MPASAEKQAETRVDAGYRGFLDFAERVGLDLERFQRKIAKAVFDSRELLVLLPRGNGKSRLIGTLAVHHLLTADRPSVYVAARVGLVRGARRARRLQHRARRGASLPGVTAAAHAGRLWKVRLGSPTGRCSRSTTCISPGIFPAASSTESSLRPILRGGSKARGWGSSSTPLRASSPSSSSSVSSLSSDG